MWNVQCLRKSGFTEYDGWTCTIAVNSKDGPQRRRFTAAHELGHFVLHRDLLKEHRHLDRLFDEAARRNPSKPLVYSHELQANQFAARLLMPEQNHQERDPRWSSHRRRASSKV